MHDIFFLKCLELAGFEHVLTRAASGRGVGLAWCGVRASEEGGRD